MTACHMQSYMPSAAACTIALFVQPGSSFARVQRHLLLLAPKRDNPPVRAAGGAHKERCMHPCTLHLFAAHMDLLAYTLHGF